MSIVTQQLRLGALPSSDAPWWLLVPIPERQSSYAPLVFFAAIAVVVVLVFVSVRLFTISAFEGPRRGIADSEASIAVCRTQQRDSGSRFDICFNRSSPLSGSCLARSIRARRYRLEIRDRLWITLYLPLGTLVRRVADKVAWLQQGRIATYLLYSFVTLVVLLALML